MIETRKSFHQQLEEMQRNIVRLGAHVTERIPRGTEAFLGGDLEAMQQLIDDDDELDELTVVIEEQCHALLVLQAPVARDLRSVVAGIRLAPEIERSGDLMVNVCKGARRVYPAQIDATVRGLIQQMSEESARLFKLAMDAYVDQNAGLAAALDDMDDRLDVLHKQYIEGLLTRREDLDLQPAVQLALIGRYYERIGDHAVNIGEQIRYMVDGWMPEQTGAARHRASPPAPAAEAMAESAGDPAEEA